MKNDDVIGVQSLIDSGEFQAARECLDILFADGKEDVEAAVLRGIACYQLGRNDDAELSYRKAINLGLRNVTLAWKNLAAMCFCSGRYAETEDLVEAYRDWLPNDVEALELLVHALINQKKHREAEEALLKWLEQRPDDLASLALLQYVLQSTHRHLESLRLLARARQGCSLPELSLIEQVFGSLLDIGWIDVADRLSGKFLATLASHAKLSSSVLWTLSSVAFEKGDYPLAARHLETMLSEGALSDKARYSVSMRLLALGNLEVGWQLYRLRSDDAKLIWDRQVPKWAGQPLGGKSVLVFSEQGAGDVIQFLRFVPLLETRGIRCTFVAYEDIVCLLAQNPEAEIRREVDVGELVFDYQLQLMDLALVWGIKAPSDIPASIPYLHASDEAVRYWKARFDALPGMKVGLVWAGNPDYGNDHWRSSSLRELSGLAALPGVTWIALQKGSAADEDIPEGFNLLRFDDELKDYSDTAAAIEALDLIISVDTSVAHLAGALGKPLWILLPRRGKDWRWFIEENSSPWYPSARLFTQPKAGCWDRLVRSEVRPALAKILLERDARNPGCLAPWQRGGVRALAAADIGGAASTGAVEGVASGDLVKLLPFARVLATADEEASLLEVIWQQTGSLGQVAWAEWAVRDKAKRADAIRLLHAFCESGAALTVNGVCAYAYALMEGGQFVEARALLREAKAAHPLHAAVTFLDAQLAERTGNRSRAIRLLGAVAMRTPRSVVAHLRLYELNRAAGKTKLALGHLERAVMLAPEDSNLKRLVARELRAANCPWLSAFILESLYADDSSKQSMLAWAAELAAQGEGLRARELLAMSGSGNEADADFSEIYSRLQVLRGLQDWPAALAAWERIIRLRPADKGMHLAYGWDLLAQGEIDAGWRHYAQGLEDNLRSSLPFWDGVDRPGGRLLVYQDQGQGDLLQFFVLVRSLPKSMRVTLAVVPSVRKLLQDQRLPCEVIGLDEVDWEGDDYDSRIQLMALPSLIGADLLVPALNYPYLLADQRLLPRWRVRTAQDSLLKIGVVWAGNPNYGNDAFRSTMLKDWLPILQIGGISLYNLQKDVSSNQALALPEFEFSNIVADCDSWQKTAAAVSMLDMVISVDSGVLHLAACLGVEAWALLPHSGTDFRWLRERDDCPWYPSVTLIRQQRDETWQSVLQRVAERLVATKAGVNWLI